MNYWTLFLIFMTFSTTAQSPKVMQKKVDINKDGVFERLEIYHDDKLVEIREDRNGDKKFDHITSFNTPKLIKVIKQDTNGDGKFDRLESHRKFKENQVQITTEVDKDHDGKYEIKYKSTHSLIQQQDCYDLFGRASVFEVLMAQVNESSAFLEDGFVPTDFGYRIDNYCLGKWGQDFPNVLKDTMNEGLACLKDLGKKYKKVTGPIRLAYEIEDLLATKETTIVCSDRSDEVGWWGGIHGYASASDSAEPILNGRVKHPYVSINPTQPNNLEFTAAGDDERRELRKTLFHEQIHNLGYLHNHSIEYPYACEDCCLSYKGEDEKERVEAACKVCGGDYANNTDPQYVEDMIAYSKISYLKKNGVSAALNFIKENPKDQLAQAYVAKVFDNYFSPISLNFMERVKKESKELVPKAQEIYNEVKDNTFEDYLNYPSAKIVSDILYESYVNQDLDATIAMLESNQDILIEKLGALKIDDDTTNDFYVDNVKESLSFIIDDLFINDHLKSQDTEDKYLSRIYQLRSKFDKALSNDYFY